MRQDYGPFTLELPEGWEDSTEEGQPFTVSRPDGVGALQFSIALYQGGAVPSPSCDELLSLLLDFAEAHALGESRDVQLEAGPPRMASATFSPDSEFDIRAWYVTDGRSLAKVTYVCGTEEFGTEVAACEAIVRSISFEER